MRSSSSRDYGHERTWHDGNGHPHLQTTGLGRSLTLPITGGRPNLGTWQQVFHLECDVKPRDRRIVVTILGELPRPADRPPAPTSAMTRFLR